MRKVIIALTALTLATAPIVAHEYVEDEKKIAEPGIGIGRETIVSEPSENLVSLGLFRLTAYCSCSDCCGVWAWSRPTDAYGNKIVYTSTGEIAEAGKTIAVDPSVIPYGTEVIIDGHTYVAQDCGGAIKENRIDVYFDDHEEALDFGVQYATVYVKEGWDNVQN